MAVTVNRLRNRMKRHRGLHLKVDSDSRRGKINSPHISHGPSHTENYLLFSATGSEALWLAQAQASNEATLVLTVNPKIYQARPASGCQ